MSRSILIASGKGGVGKSTVTARLGMIFADMGLNTLLIDCDAGLSSLEIMLNVQDATAFSWYDVCLERCNSDEALIKINDRLHLMPAPSSALTEDAPDAVKQAIAPIRDNYDIILADAPAGITAGLIRAANAVKQAIIIATGDEVSVKCAAALDKAARACGVEQSRLLINRYDLKAAKKGKLLSVDDIIDKTYVQLLGIIPEDKEIVYSTVTRNINKKSKSFKAISRTAERINGKNVELSLSLIK